MTEKIKIKSNAIVKLAISIDESSGNTLKFKTVVIIKSKNIISNTLKNI